MSFVDIGGIVPNWIKDGNSGNEYNYNKIVWLELTPDFYWSANCQGISFGKPGTGNTFTFGANNHSKGGKMFAIFDTGTSFTLIPKSYFKPFIDNLVKMFGIEKYEVTNGIFAFECREKIRFGAIQFMFNRHWYMMNPDDYIFNASAPGEPQTLCAIAIVANRQDFFLFGNSFLRGYYSIHDMDTNGGQLGIVPH